MPGYDPRHHYAGTEGFEADEQNLYWLAIPNDLSAQSHIEIFTQSLTGGAPRLLSSVDHPHSTTLGSLVATRDALYFSAGEFSSSRGHSALYRVPKSGGPAKRVLEFPEGSGVSTIVATTEAIYWRETRWQPESAPPAIVDELRALPLAGGEPRVVAVLPARTGDYHIRARGAAVGMRALSTDPYPAPLHVLVFYMRRLGAPLEKIFDTTERAEATFELGEHHAFLTLGNPLESSGPAPLLAIPFDGGVVKRFATLTGLTSITVVGDDAIVADDEYPEDHPSWLDSGARSVLLRRFDPRGSSTQLLRTDCLYAAPIFERGGNLYFSQASPGGRGVALYD